MATYRRLAANTAATFGGRAAAIVIALVLSTVLFRALGPARYGVWSFCYVLVGYLTLFDLGLGATVERLVARHYSASEHGRVEQVLNFAVTCAVVFAALLQLLVLVTPLERVASIDLRPVANVLPLCLLLSLASTITGSGLSGIQQMGRLNLVRTCANTASAGTIMALAVAGVTRVEVLLLVHAAGLASAAFACWRLVGKSVGRLRLAPFSFDRALATEFARFAGAMQVATFAPQLADQLFRVLLGVRFGAPYMGYYDLGSRAAISIRSIVSALFVAMVPFSTQQHVTGGAPAIARLYRLTLKYTGIALVPLSALAMYHSRLLIELWLGVSAGSEAVLMVCRVLLVVHVIAGLSGPVTMIARSVGIAGPEALWQSLAGALGLVGAWFAPGPAAAVSAFGGSAILGVLALWTRLRARLSLRVPVLRDLAAVSAMAVLVVAIAAGADVAVTAFVAGASATTLLARAFLAGLLPLLIAAVLYWTAGFVTDEERRFWKTIGPSGSTSSTETDPALA